MAIRSISITFHSVDHVAHINSWCCYMCQSSHSLSFLLSQSLWFFILNYRCLSYSISNPNLLSSAQLLFIITNLFSTRTWSTRLFREFISYDQSKLSPIRLSYDDLIQLIPERQDLQFFRVYYSTSLLYLSYKPSSFPTSLFLTLSLASSHPPPSHSSRFNISLPPST